MPHFAGEFNCRVDPRRPAKAESKRHLRAEEMARRDCAGISEVASARAGIRWCDSAGDAARTYHHENTRSDRAVNRGKLLRR
jgi:hypothetical protein